MFCGMWKFNVVGALVTRPVVLSWQLGSAQLDSLPVFATRERFFVVSSLLSPYSHHMPLNRLNVSVLGAQLSHSWRRNVCVWGVKKNPLRMMCECVLAFATFQAFRTYLCLRLLLPYCFLAEHMNFYLIHVYLSRILNPTLPRGNSKWYIYYQGFLTSCHPSPDPIPFLPPSQTILVIVHSWPLK